jgi:hypothetical protein
VLDLQIKGIEVSGYEYNADYIMAVDGERYPAQKVKGKVKKEAWRVFC